MKKFTLIMALMVLAACSSKHKAKEIDTNVKDAEAITPNSVIGVKDGEMIYQKKVMMNEQLRNLELEVYNLEAKVYGGPRYLDNRGLYGVLQDCRLQMSEPKNGGDGKLLWTEKREYVTQESDYTNIGTDKKKIIGVSEEYLKDRIDRFVNYKAVLQGRQEEYETKVKVCELEFDRQKKKASNN
ncbi:hypothetical protein [Bdellovibrio sp. HCB337]|uniref:hypothetical protein n=1 Tax=Bdellovibrio sp. HCB337 TaxID=3394358 RepID=UPI0039A5C1C3